MKLENSLSCDIQTSVTPVNSLVFHNSQPFDKHAHKLISVHTWLQNLPDTTSELCVQHSEQSDRDVLKLQGLWKKSQTFFLTYILYMYDTCFLYTHTVGSSSVVPIPIPDPSIPSTHTVLACCRGMKGLVLLQVPPLVLLAVSRLGDITLSLSSLELL